MTISRRLRFGTALFCAVIAVASSVSVRSLAAPAETDRTAHIVAAPDAPVRLDSAKVLNTGADPLVLLYAATNTSRAAIEVFTVTVFVFDNGGRLKARQVAPGRRELGVGETKYSAMVLDVGAIEASETLLAGVDQVQRVGSEEWWRTDLRAIAEPRADQLRGAPPKK